MLHNPYILKGVSLLNPEIRTSKTSDNEILYFPLFEYSTIFVCMNAKGVKDSVDSAFLFSEIYIWHAAARACTLCDFVCYCLCRNSFSEDQDLLTIQQKASVYNSLDDDAQPEVSSSQVWLIFFSFLHTLSLFLI